MPLDSRMPLLRRLAYPTMLITVVPWHLSWMGLLCACLPWQIAQHLLVLWELVSREEAFLHGLAFILWVLCQKPHQHWKSQLSSAAVYCWNTTNESSLAIPGTGGASPHLFAHFLPTQSPFAATPPHSVLLTFGLPCLRGCWIAPDIWLSWSAVHA